MYGCDVDGIKTCRIYYDSFVFRFSLEKATEITYVENGSSKMEFLSIWKRKVLDY